MLYSLSQRIILRHKCHASIEGLALYFGAAKPSFALTISLLLDRQLGVSPPEPDAINQDADIRAYHGDIARKASNGAEEVAEQDHYAVQLDEEPDQRPAQQDQQEPCEEGAGPLCLLPSREEQERLLWSDDDG